MTADPWEETKEEVKEIVADALKKLKIKVKEKDLINSIEEPPSFKMGDLACSVAFQLRAKLKKSPREIAELILSKIKKPPSMTRIKLAGAYINFFVKKDKFAKQIISEALKDDYGKGEAKKDKVMVEYSQANTHKPFHIGHVRGTSLGESLSRILKHAGYEVVQVNYQGDIGSHVAKTLWCYMKFHENETPTSSKGTWLGELYTEANKKLLENPEYKEEVDEIAQKLETKEDEKLMKLWEETRQWSLDDFEEIYKELDVHFDHYFFESEFEERGKELMKEVLKKKIAKRSKGAVIVDLKKEKLDVFILLKSDGTSLYSTRDLALAEEKFKKYKIKRSIYVVGSEQRLYFQQLFKTLELMGFKQAKKCFHLAYDLVTLKEGKMSSREGTAILYKDLHREMLQKALEEVLARNPEMDPYVQKQIAGEIAIGAMKFSMLNISNNKTIFFDWNKALEFEGETAPYIQYAAVRAKRILEKVKETPKTTKVKFKGLEKVEEQKLVKYLAKFSSVVKESAENYKPNLIANYSLSLAERFNAFYDASPVLDAENKDVGEARLLLVGAAYKVLEKCLYLLGIKVPERM